MEILLIGLVAVTVIVGILNYVKKQSVTLSEIDLQKIKNQIEESNNKQLSGLVDKLNSAQREILKDQSELRENILKILNERLTDVIKSNNENSKQITDQLESVSRRITQGQSDFKESLLRDFKTQGDQILIRLKDQAESIQNQLKIFEQNTSAAMTQNFEKLTTTVEQKLELISGKVTENLKEGFEKTNQTFVDITTRLTKIDEAQKKIESLSQNVVSLQDVLNDKKSRGIFGEVQLNQILTSVFGDKNDKLYQLQYKFSNGTIADSVLFLPEPIGKLAVDSKFPLENYQRMISRELLDSEIAAATRDFKQNMKKHIDDIAGKYIISGETAEMALLFLPAEVIFSELYSYHQDIITYSQTKNVWIVSPSTFMGMLTTIQSIIRDMETQKQAKVIQEELKKLSQEFGRYKERWSKLATHIDTVSKDVQEINITSEKITKRFEQIERVELLDQDSADLKLNL